MSRNITWSLIKKPKQSSRKKWFNWKSSCKRVEIDPFLSVDQQKNCTKLKS